MNVAKTRCNTGVLQTLTVDNEEVTDQLYLSVWLDRNGRAQHLRQYEKLLRLFPFSQREQPQTTASILAVDSTEPPLLERPMNGPFELEEVLEVFAAFRGDDIAYTLESWWDLWAFDGTDWKLTPCRVLLSCFGPEFHNGAEEDSAEQEDLRIDFGVDSRYLPDPNWPGSARLVESNIKSLLRLVHELDTELALTKRVLQTETGENFAQRLQRVLQAEIVQ